MGCYIEYVGLVATDFTKLCANLLHLISEGALLAAELFCNLTIRKLVPQQFNDAVCIRIKLAEPCNELFQEHCIRKNIFRSRSSIGNSVIQIIELILLNDILYSDNLYNL